MEEGEIVPRAAAGMNGSSSLRVRKAAPRDLQCLARMLGAARREDGVEPWALELDQLRVHAFGTGAKFESWIAAIAGRPVGCAAAHRGYDMRLARPTLVLTALYVEEAERGGGVARHLLAAAAARALQIGAREISITAGLGNAAGRKFLQGLGAEEQRIAAYMLGFDHLEWLAQERL